MRVCFPSVGLIAGAVLLSGGLPSAMAAGPAIDLSQTLKAGQPISIENTAGSVTVHGSERPGLHVGGTRGNEAQEVRILHADDHLTVKVIYPNRGAAEDGTDLEVSMPADSPLVVGTVSGNVNTDGHLASEHLQTVSGDVSLDADTTTIDAQSVSGDIDVTTDEAAPSRVTLASTSGDVSYEGGLAGAGHYALDAVSGDIELMVPGRASARYRLATLSGDIDNDIGPSPRRADGSPKLVLDFTQGSGQAQVEGRTVSGDIALSAD